MTDFSGIILKYCLICEDKNNSVEFGILLNCNALKVLDTQQVDVGFNFILSIVFVISVLLLKNLPCMDFWLRSL